MACLNIVASESVLEQLKAAATARKTTPELLASALIDDLCGGSPLEVAQDILGDPNLQAMIERAEAERRTGRTHSHGEVLEWERSRRD
jgi:hypothetical protein